MNDELLKQAHKCLAIEKVILTNLTVNCHPNYDPGFSNEPLSVQYRAGPASNRKHFDLSCEDESSTTVCRFYFNCGVRLVASSEEADEDVADDAVMYEINAEFAADYRLECKIDDEEGLYLNLLATMLVIMFGHIGGSSFSHVVCEQL